MRPALDAGGTHQLSVPIVRFGSFWRIRNRLARRDRWTRNWQAQLEANKQSLIGRLFCEQILNALPLR